MSKGAPGTLKALPATKGTQFGKLLFWEGANTHETPGQAPLQKVPVKKPGHPDRRGATAKLQRGTLCSRVAQVPEDRGRGKTTAAWRARAALDPPPPGRAQRFSH